MEQRLSFITLGVADLDRARAFYAALGWRASAYGEGKGIVFHQLGGMVLSLFPRHDLAEEVGVADGKPGFSGVTLSYNTRGEAEVDAILAEATSAGGGVLKPAQKMFWGGYSGYFADPDGHVWEACFNPHLTVAEDGSVRLPDA